MLVYRSCPSKKRRHCYSLLCSTSDIKIVISPDLVNINQNDLQSWAENGYSVPNYNAEKGTWELTCLLEGCNMNVKETVANGER